MDHTSTPQFHVGYDNGYGYAGRVADAVGPDPSAAGAAPAHPSFAHTVALPAEELAAARTGHDEANREAPERTRSANPWVIRSLVLGGLAFVVLLGAVAVLLVGRAGATNLAATASSTSKGKAATTTGTRVDEHGDLIADSITFLPPTTASPDVTTTVTPSTPDTAVVTSVTPTAPPATTAPVTAPATTAPTVPPTTAAPTTSTSAPTTTSTTAPVVKITTFSHPSSVSCANPANQVPYIPLSWSTQNAVKVTVSIDGPGIYKTYMGASGNDTVPFSCPGPHTYLITAYSATNQVATQQVVISKS